MPSARSRVCNVLVIGTGAAGLRAAIAATEAGSQVLVVGKRHRLDAHTVLAAGGINAVLGTRDPEDSWEQHFADTLREGYFIGHPRMVEIMAQEAPAAVRELADWGCPFARLEDGRLDQRFFGAHTYRRTCYAGDYTGRAVLFALAGKAQQLAIPVIEDQYISRLLVADRACFGAYGFDLVSGERTVFEADAVVLATGGHTRLWRRSSSRRDENYGEGMSLALEAGCRLMDMELVQFHPTGMVLPEEVAGTLVTEAVRGEGGYLTNREGKRFMLEVDPKKKELSSRDVVARAIYKEVQAGRGTEHGGAYLDVRHLGPEKIKKKLPSMYEQFLKLADVDITKQPMEIAPTIHYAMGGLRVEAETGATTLPGLYAAGEAAAGLHGANRLGGNSLSDLLVFGRRAGAAAGAYVREVQLGKIDERQVTEEQRILLLPLSADGTENTYLLQQQLQKAMQDGAGLAREEKSLKACLDKILELRQRSARIHVPGSRKYNPGWHTARDLRFMLTVAEAIVRAAIERRESRGAHWRLDYLEKDPALGRVNFIAYNDGGHVTLKTRPVPEMPPELAKLFAEPESSSPAPPPAASPPKPQQVRT